MSGGVPEDIDSTHVTRTYQVYRGMSPTSSNRLEVSQKTSLFSQFRFLDAVIIEPSETEGSIITTSLIITGSLKDDFKSATLISDTRYFNLDIMLRFYFR